MCALVAASLAQANQVNQDDGAARRQGGDLPQRSAEIMASNQRDAGSYADNPRYSRQNDSLDLGTRPGGYTTCRPLTQLDRCGYEEGGREGGREEG